jgi:hypothetical protein
MTSKKNDPPSLDAIIASILALAEQARTGVRLRYDELEGIKVSQTPGELLDEMINERARLKEEAAQAKETSKITSTKAPPKVASKAQPTNKPAEPDTSKPMTDQEVIDFITEVIADQGGKAKAPEIIQALGSASSFWQRQRRQLLADGVIVSHGSGRSMTYSLPSKG